MANDGQIAVTSGLRMNEAKRRIHRGIGWRLLISILLVSSLVTLVLTVGQLYFEFRRDVGEIERRLNELQSSYAESLAGSLWQFDTEQIRLQLAGIQRLPDIQAVELRETNGASRQPLIIRSGELSADPAIAREFPLVFADRSSARTIGVLRVEASFEHIYSRLMDSALVILLNQGIKTFIVSLFILLIVHRLVTRHLIDLADVMEPYDPSHPGQPLTLDRPASASPDELDRMVQAIQSMRDSLSAALARVQDANLEMEAEIEQRRETEARLQELVEKLTVSNSELQRFAYVASHDLQEPLRGIVMYAQKLEKNYRDRLDKEAGDNIDFIVGNARQMYDLVNDLLAFSRLGRGLTFAKVGLDACCNAALSSLDEVISKSKAKVSVSSLPEVMGNAIQLSELFENLIDNAIKFARPGIAPDISIQCLRQDGQFVISVADNGIGIEASNQNVFDIFRRHHTHQAFPGTGVGLAICKRIVQLHHGRIWHESKPGEGTTFFFTLGQAPTPAGRTEE